MKESEKLELLRLIDDEKNDVSVRICEALTSPMFPRDLRRSLLVDWARRALDMIGDWADRRSLDAVAFAAYGDGSAATMLVLRSDALAVLVDLRDGAQKCDKRESSARYAAALAALETVTPNGSAVNCQRYLAEVAYSLFSIHDDSEHLNHVRSRLVRFPTND